MTQVQATNDQTNAADPGLGLWFGAVVLWTIATALVLHPWVEGFKGWGFLLGLRVAAFVVAGVLCTWLFVRTRPSR